MWLAASAASLCRSVIASDERPELPNHPLGSWETELGVDGMSYNVLACVISAGLPGWPHSFSSAAPPLVSGVGAADGTTGGVGEGTAVVWTDKLLVTAGCWGSDKLGVCGDAGSTGDSRSTEGEGAGAPSLKMSASEGTRVSTS